MNEEQSHYCVNLIEVNKKQAVIVSHAIYNDQGLMLLAEGAHLNEKRVQTLLQYNLLKPLEQCIRIEGSFNAKKLFTMLNNFAETIPALHAVTNNSDYQQALRIVCSFYEKYPLLQQNLSVLALSAPVIYYEGVVSALAGLAITLKLNLNLKEQESTFIAGLFHNIGFLYLARELREKSQGFTTSEWKALQAHPIIAQNFLKLAPTLPDEIGYALATHHERIDGTGYPHQLFGDRLSIVSQIIAATDNIIANHARYQDFGVHAHQMQLMALKFSDNIYFESVYDAAMVLFKQTPFQSLKSTKAISAVQLLTRQNMLQQQFTHTKFLAQQLIIYSKNPIVRSINAAMGRLAISVVRSGILQPEQEDWLGEYSAETTTDDDLALAEISVMHDQIYDQLIHLKNLMERVIEAIPPTEVAFKDIAEKTLRDINLADPVEE